MIEAWHILRLNSYVIYRHAAHGNELMKLSLSSYTAMVCIERRMSSIASFWIAQTL